MSDTERYDRFEADERRWSALMASAHGGDQTSYHTLLDELAVVIERYIRVRFGTLDTLEDCVQECLLTIHKARHTYDTARQFRPWLFTLVRHRVIDVLRQQRSELRLEQADEEAAPGDPDAILHQLDGIRVLQNLSPDHREAVALTKYVGMTTAEAATWLGINETAVKARLRRGLLAIRKQMETEEYWA
ncbi:MAG: sigma-70 family RNA polymerase sigma factor [Gammaproteobacteria bacterium]|nr:sigma-70 family RNA polymerase sigma factor [Gammaproteobacteria bacterium]